MRRILTLIIVFLFFSNLVEAQTNTAPEILYPNLKKPTSLYVTQDHIYVVESGRNRVLKLNLLGDLVTTIGGLGSGDYELDSPIDVDATNGLKIYVSDNRNNRIQIFDKRFQYLTSLKRYPWGRSQRPIRPTQLVVNNVAELFFYDQDSKSIISVDDNGIKLDEFQIPSQIREVSDMQAVGRNLYILDLKSKQYHVMSYNGLQISSYPLQGATQIYVDKQGEEWLITETSIKNSRENTEEIEFPEKLVIKDVVKTNGLFYVLTNKSVLMIYADK